MRLLTGPTLRILYVDDDEFLRDSLAVLLTDEGYDVELATSAADGLERLRANPPHLVIADYAMPPGEHGVWMLNQAQRRGYLDHTAALILTATEDIDDDGGWEVIRKPVDVDTLLTRVHRALAPARATELARAQLRHGGGVSQDRERMAAPKIEFVLYISAASPSSVKAVRNMTRLLAHYEPGEVQFEIRDLSRQPLRDDDEDRVAFTPTLVKRTPPPRTWVIGDLDNIVFVSDLITYAGVERKR